MSENIARPVHAERRPTALTRLGDVASALKILHGEGMTFEQYGQHFVFFTAGDKCGCHRCADDMERVIDDDSGMVSFQGMIVCSECGNKRCPHATDHRIECSGSNEPGQRGSIYGPDPSVVTK